MENNKQTAVEWFVEQLKIEEGIDFIPTSLFEQAKKMEENIEESKIRFAYMAGYNRGLDNNPNHLENYIKYIKYIKSK
jgi:hypothetical protein